MSTEEIVETNIEELAIAHGRVLGMDAVQRANSGHPGMVMGMADITTVLYHDFLTYDPQDPQWYNRDRVILSNGHGSMLLYSMLHLTGISLEIEDLKTFDNGILQLQDILNMDMHQELRRQPDLWGRG